MTMQSSSLLPALRQLPTGDESGQNRSFRDNITNIVSMDRAMYAAEFAAGVSGGLWAVFDDINIDDAWLETVTQAHQSAFPDYSGTLNQHWNEVVEFGPDSSASFLEQLRGEAGIREASELLGFDETIGNVDDRLFDAFRETNSIVAESQSLFDFYSEKVELGERSSGGVVSDLKGRIGEYIANDNLINGSYPDLVVALSPNHPFWDSFSEQSNTYFQTKVGYERHLAELAKKMEESIAGIREINPDATVLFPSTHETIEAMSLYRQPLADQMLDIIGRNSEIERHVRNSLITLVENEGLDIPDELIEQIITDPDFLPIESITDGLETLTGNLGIDVPDSLVEIIPLLPQLSQRLAS